MAFAMPMALPGETVEQYMERTRREKQEKDQKEVDRQRRIALEAKKNPIWLREQERNQRREAELRSLREQKEEQTLEATRTGKFTGRRTSISKTSILELHMGQHVHSVGGNDAASVSQSGSKSHRGVSPSGSNAGGAYMNGVMNVSPSSYTAGAASDDRASAPTAHAGHGPREYDPNAGFDTYALDASGFVAAHGAPLSVSGLHSSPVHGTRPHPSSTGGAGGGFVTPGGPTRAAGGAVAQKGAAGRARVGGVTSSKPGSTRASSSTTATRGAAPVTAARSQVMGTDGQAQGQTQEKNMSSTASVVSNRSKTAPRVVSRKPSAAASVASSSVPTGRGAALLHDALTTTTHSEQSEPHRPGPNALETAASQVVDLLSPIGKILGPGATFEQVQLAAALVGALTGGSTTASAPAPGTYHHPSKAEQATQQQTMDAPPSPPPAPAVAPPPPSGLPPSDAARLLMSPGTAAVAAPGREVPALLPPGAGSVAPPPPSGAPPAYAGRVSDGVDASSGSLSLSSVDPLRITPPGPSMHPQQLALLAALGLPDVAAEMQKSMDRVVELEERLALVLTERSDLAAHVRDAVKAVEDAVSAAVAADREALLLEDRGGSPLDGYGPRGDSADGGAGETEESTPRPAGPVAEEGSSHAPASLLHKVKGLAGELARARARCDALATQVAGAQAALAQAELEHVQAVEALHGKYKAELEEVARQPSLEQVQALQQLTERTLAAEAEKGRLEVELSTAQRELKSLQEQIKQLKSSGLGAEIDGLKSALGEREKEVATLKEAHAQEMRSLRLGSVAAAAQAAASAGLESIRSPGKPHGRPVALREVQRWAAEEAIACATPLAAPLASGLRAPPPTRESFSEAADGVGAGGFTLSVALKADDTDATTGTAPSPTTPATSAQHGVSMVESLEYADILEAMANELSSLRDKLAEAHSARAAEAARARVVEEELQESLTAAQARALQAEEKLASITRDFNEFKLKYKGTDKIEAKLKELDAAQSALTTERTEWLAKLKSEHDELQSTFKEARTAKESWLTEMSLLAAERQGMDAERGAREERERLLLQALANVGMGPPPLPPVPMPAATVQAASKSASRAGTAKPGIVAVRLPSAAPAVARGLSPSRAAAQAPSHSNRPPPPPPPAAPTRG